MTSGLAPAAAGESGTRWVLAPLAALSLCLLTPVAMALVTVWLAGWKLQLVETGSMEPTYPVGSVLVVQPVDASEVRVGMAIVFEDPEQQRRLVGHRVIEVLPATPPQFRTQGDANNVADAFPVPGRYVRGRVRWQISHAGMLLSWLDWPGNALVLIGLPTLLLITGEVGARRRRRLRVGGRLEALEIVEPETDRAVDELRPSLVGGGADRCPWCGAPERADVLAGSPR